jgi:hypothetical protein
LLLQTDNASSLRNQWQKKKGQWRRDREGLLRLHWYQIIGHITILLSALWNLRAVTTCWNFDSEYRPLPPYLSPPQWSLSLVKSYWCRPCFW